ncbi:hypothetical protein F5148DRAFT_1145434 [Russula earlei]|uniref:Uncharacterized protein n=1 Tax=Russula earlei TaxID=71964 RepID=A0ACC0UP43_9AGAM|nr:hypothetical protein F5148DRAFT_1145434 [Russula earlei]
MSPKSCALAVAVSPPPLFCCSVQNPLSQSQSISGMPSISRVQATRDAPSSSHNFEALFHAALAKYTKQTGTVLVDHPLMAALEDCSSPDAVLAIFEKQAQAFDQFRKGDLKLSKWLRPLVNCLCALCTSAAVATTACVVFPPAKAVLSGIGVLLSAASL